MPILCVASNSHRTISEVNSHAAISASQVKELRERTGLGMMECKKALTEADGDIEVAIENLRKSSGLKAAKKADRIAAEGVVVTRVAEDGSYGVMVEINSETDFVARDDNFIAFADKIAGAFFTAKSEDVAAVMAGELETAREQLVQKIGENIGVRRAIVVNAVDGGLVGEYVHGGRIGVLTVLTGGNSQVAKDVAMHVAAINLRLRILPICPKSSWIRKKRLFWRSRIWPVSRSRSQRKWFRAA